MSEALRNGNTFEEAVVQGPAINPAERAVFGDIYSFRFGRSDPQSITDFIESRTLEAESGAATWVPVAIDSVYGVIARYYKDCKTVALLDVNISDSTADVFVKGKGKSCNKPLFKKPVSFNKAVACAEKLAEELPKES